MEPINFCAILVQAGLFVCLVSETTGGVTGLTCFQCDSSQSSCEDKHLMPDSKYLKACPSYAGANNPQQPVCSIWTYHIEGEEKERTRRQCLYMAVDLSKHDPKNKKGHLKWGYIDPPRSFKSPDFTHDSKMITKNEFYVCNDGHACNKFPREHHRTWN